MGPILLCDKSAIQSLQRSAPSLLHRYFWINIPPILVIEILGDLTKKNVSKDAQSEVQRLAQRLGSTSAIPNVSCRDLIHTELHGIPIRLDGRPKVAEGATGVAANGQVVTKVADDPCEHALLRWRAGDFSKDEETFSQVWRDYKELSHWQEALLKLRISFSPASKQKSNLDDTLDFVDDIINMEDPLRLLEWLLDDFGFSHSRISEIISDYQTLPKFVLKSRPYTHYCVRASLFAHLAMSFQLVSQKADNRIDLDYLFYLPFCNVFTSHDKFHRALAPYLLTKDQVFAKYEDLAADLKRTADHQAGLAPDELEIELRLPGPPEDESSIVHQIWRKFMKPGYRTRPRPNLTPDQERKLMDHMKMLMASSPSASGAKSGKPDAVFRNRPMLTSDPCPCGSGKAYRDCHQTK